MKRHIITILLLLICLFQSFGQLSDQFVGNCIMNAGTDARYLKDFRIQLGTDTVQNELRFKAHILLWKNTKYRFTMCITDDTKGELILNIKDEANNVILSSIDQKSGRIYPVVDLKCSESGIYQLNYDFTNGQPGSGVGVVSIIK